MAATVTATALCAAPVRAQDAASVRIRPWSGGVVPIQFSPAITPEQKAMVWEACASWATYADIECRERTTERAYVRLEAGYGDCSAQYGAPLIGAVTWNMNPAGCWFTRTVHHELGHVLGLQHEHQRADRDEYIDVALDRIALAARASFLRTDYQDVGPYDFLSVMHYPDYAAAGDLREPSIRPKPEYAEYAGRLGESERPTAWDGAAVAAIYGPPRVEARPYLRFVHVGQVTTIEWSFHEAAVVRWTLHAGTAPGASDLLVADLGLAQQVSGRLPVTVPVFLRVVAHTSDGREVISNELNVVLPATPAIHYLTVEGHTVEMGWSALSGRGTLHVSNAFGHEILSLPVAGGHLLASNVPPGFYLLRLASDGHWSPMYLVVVP